MEEFRAASLLKRVSKRERERERDVDLEIRKKEI